MIRDRGGRGRAVGSITLYRGAGERPWSGEDKRRLATLQPFFGLGLADRSDPAAPLTEGSDQGLIVADTAGKPVYFSREGRRMLHLALNPHPAPGSKFSPTNILPPPLVQLCGNLVRLFGDDPYAAAPVWHHRNAWGGFTFEARWLRGDGSEQGLIAITSRHFEPLPIRLFRRIGELP
jgi:hypothetical protein